MAPQHCFLHNVKGDSRLTEGEAENEAAPPKNGRKSELGAGQSLMSTDLFSLVWFEWGRFIHDGILWVKDDNGISVLAEAASKEFYNRILHQIETGSYSREDVQAIQNYCLGGFRYECLSRTSNNRPPEQDYLRGEVKSNSNNLKLDQRVFGHLSQNFGQGIYRDPNLPQESYPSPPLYRPTQDYLEEILIQVSTIRSLLLEHGTEQKHHNLKPNTSDGAPSLAEQRTNLKSSASELQDDQKEACLENGERVNNSSYSYENIIDDKQGCWFVNTFIFNKSVEKVRG